MPQTATPATSDDAPRVSGSLAAHYAPTTPLRLVAPAQLADVVDALQQAGRRCAVVCRSPLPQAVSPHALRKLPDDPRGYARALYRALRELDHSAADLIVVEDVPVTPSWAAVTDRLRRSAAGAQATGLRDG
ncbi:MAG: hypothetical protein CRU72_11935 [Candidatus Accumulibacter phosphatis]|nr:hypothetical protein [Candidatus Accumulibacter phosphatis]